MNALECLMYGNIAASILVTLRLKGLARERFPDLRKYVRVALCTWVFLTFVAGGFWWLTGAVGLAALQLVYIAFFGMAAL